MAQAELIKARNENQRVKDQKQRLTNNQDKIKNLSNDSAYQNMSVDIDFSEIEDSEI